ncbi:flavin reductase [Parabacteroides sp. Marseille-P3160]|uniref:flavin reductase n=1 Tax=Parabacteroides sp. Marseille-P3160 TaxID=1917887 RepID=UPI0009BBB29B|nr:flavin reductase [Parabacteroides sp. Marseille-P3160]
MKKIWFLSFIVLFASCNNAGKTAQETSDKTTSDSVLTTDVNIKDKTFEDLFREITPEQIPESIFKLVGKDNTVITSGTATHFNSMVASDGGVGLLMGKPVTFCGLRASRYTLEIILKEKTYTMTYFEEKYRDQYMIFGQKSGRDSNKMKESTLTPVETPSGKISYKEAKLIIECTLAQTLTVDPEECYSEKNKNFFTEAYKEVGAYHKIVFGDITNVWIKK